MQRLELLLSVDPCHGSLAAILDLQALPTAQIEGHPAFQVSQRLQRGGSGLFVGARYKGDVALQFRVCYGGAVSKYR